MQKKTYVIYDKRAEFEGEDNASVLSVEESLKDAQDIIEEMEWDACIFEYDDTDDELTNGILIK